MKALVKRGATKEKVAAVTLRTITKKNRDYPQAYLSRSRKWAQEKQIYSQVILTTSRSLHQAGDSTHSKSHHNSEHSDNLINTSRQTRYIQNAHR